MESDSITTALILGVLILTASYFSAAEMAFSSLNRIRMKNMADNKNKRAVLVCKLIKDYDKLLSTILIGNNIVNIAAASIATVLFVKLMGDKGVTVSTAIVTVVIIIFGEITPKSLAKKTPEKFALFSAPLMQVFVIILIPVNFLLSLWQKLISSLFRGNTEDRITEAELLTILEEAEQDGAINEADSELIHSAIEFNDRIVEDILTPRVDIVGISTSQSKNEISNAFSESGYSRIAVFDKSIDNIIGIIHIKDFFDFIMQNKENLEDIIKPVIFIPYKIKISDLFKRFQETKGHFAVVTDEYGGTLGIVTMEDVLEELVGEIWDEHDEIIEDFVKLDDNTYQIICSADIDKMYKFFDLAGEVDSSTVSGWIMEQLGEIPKEGDKFRYEDLMVTVQKTDQRRVVQCLITKDVTE